MASRRTNSDSSESRRAPAMTPEARENQLAAMAYDLAEKQLRDGSASSQTIQHFLKYGSSRDRLERQKIQHENELLKVKREAIESAARTEELYAEAMRSMRYYNGEDEDEDEQDFDD